MKRMHGIFGKVLIPILLIVVGLAAMMALPLLQTAPEARAATPLSGAQSAKAGTGGVTSGLFVKLEAAGTVITATAVTDSVVGVCELTASANALTRYAPVGTQSTVTSGEAITVGDLLTAGTGGKAFVLDTDDASTQRYCAIALTAASGADESVTVAVAAGAAEQRLNLPSLTAETLTVDHATTPAISLATGKTNTGTITVAGKTAGSLIITTADDTTAAITFTSAAQTGGAVTLTIPDLAGVSDVVAAVDLAQTLTTKTIDGDDNTVQDLGVGTPKVLTTVDESAVGIPFLIIFEPTAAGTLTYTVPAGKKLRVLDAYGFKMAGAGAHGDDDLNLQNNDGSAANIFATEELNTIGDKARILFDDLDDAERDVAAASTLDLVANENAGNGCDTTIYVLCVWVTP